MKQLLFDKLITGENWDQISLELESIEQHETIIEKLLVAFPGYYGCFISLHFSCFLDEPIKTNEQQDAYNKIVNFLDNAIVLEFPKELRDFLIECTRDISTQNIVEIDKKNKQAFKNTEAFLSDNKEFLDRYIRYKQSDEYKNSSLHRIQEMFRKFNTMSGYYDIFIPAMKKLSTLYSKYYKQIEIANEKLLLHYPKIRN